MTLLLFVTNQLSYTQKESHLVRDGLETQTLKWETHSDSSEIISWHGREWSSGISLPQWPIRLWIYFQMVSEHLSSCQHIKPVPEPIDVNMSLSILSTQLWSYPWKVQTSKCIWKGFFMCGAASLLIPCLLVLCHGDPSRNIHLIIRGLNIKIFGIHWNLGSAHPELLKFLPEFMTQS